MFERKITLGGSKRHTGFSKKKVLWLVLAVLIIFLSIWQVPLKQTEVSENVVLPTPTEVK